MATKTLTITEDAYDYLKSMKPEGKSFSKVILDLKRNRDVMRYAGAFKGVDFSSVEDVRSQLNAELENRQ